MLSARVKAQTPTMLFLAQLYGSQSRHPNVCLSVSWEFNGALTARMCLIPGIWTRPRYQPVSD